MASLLVSLTRLVLQREQPNRDFPFCFRVRFTGAIDEAPLSEDEGSSMMVEGPMRF